MTRVVHVLGKNWRKKGAKLPRQIAIAKKKKAEKKITYRGKA